jgi:hypothetical protein
VVDIATGLHITDRALLASAMREALTWQESLRRGLTHTLRRVPVCTTRPPEREPDTGDE